jgi:hypothetical protein
VLTDIRIPVQDGISTIVAMRRDGAIEKPFDVDELVAMIRPYLRSVG